MALGLREAQLQGARHVTLASDSDLLVGMVAGSKQPGLPHMQALLARLRPLVAGFETCNVLQVPREVTVGADRIANEVLDTGTAVRRVFPGARRGEGLPGGRISLARAVVAGQRVALMPHHRDLDHLRHDTEEALVDDPTTEVFLVVPDSWGSTKFTALRFFKHQVLDPQLTSTIVRFPARCVSHVPQPMPERSARIQSLVRWLVSLADT